MLEKGHLYERILCRVLSMKANHSSLAIIPIFIFNWPENYHFWIISVAEIEVLQLKVLPYFLAQIWTVFSYTFTQTRQHRVWAPNACLNTLGTSSCPCYLTECHKMSNTCHIGLLFYSKPSPCDLKTQYSVTEPYLAMRVAFGHLSQLKPFSQRCSIKAR